MYEPETSPTVHQEQNEKVPGCKVPVPTDEGCTDASHRIGSGSVSRWKDSLPCRGFCQLEFDSI